MGHHSPAIVFANPLTVKYGISLAEDLATVDVEALKIGRNVPRAVIAAVEVE